MSEEQDQHPEWISAEASDIDPTAFYVVAEGEPLIGPFRSQAEAEAYPVDDEFEHMVIDGARALRDVFIHGPVPLAKPIWPQ
jgi:hypothetical protein